MANKQEYTKCNDDSSFELPEVGTPWDKIGNPAYSPARFSDGQVVNPSNRWHKQIGVAGQKKLAFDFYVKHNKDNNITDGILGDTVGGYSAFDNYNGAFTVAITSVPDFPRGIFYYFPPLPYMANDNVWYGISIDLTKPVGQKCRMFSAIEGGVVEELVKNSHTEYIDGDFGGVFDIAFGSGYGNGSIIDDFIIWDDAIIEFPNWDKEGREGSGPVTKTYYVSKRGNAITAILKEAEKITNDIQPATLLRLEGVKTYYTENEDELIILEKLYNKGILEKVQI